MKTKEAVELFWKENNYGKDGGVYDKLTTVSVGGFSFSFPNLHNEAFVLHDVNHLISDIEVGWIGEFKIAAWELGSGGRKGYHISWAYPILTCFIGLFLAPKQVIRYFKKGLQYKNAHVLSHEVNVLDTEIDKLKELSRSK